MGHRFERYCKDYENIENYQKAKADNFKGWHCHHRKGIDTPREELKALGLYYNRPASELIFLTLSEHSKLHGEGENNPMYGKYHSTEAKKKNSEAHKGKKHSEESKKKMSESHKGKPKTEEWKNKIGEAHKGKKRSEETRNRISEAKKGHLVSEEQKNKQSKAIKGRSWYTNGKVCVMSFECPDGFVPGRIKKL